jgi:uncharacterized protein (DUF924 family)
MCMSTDYTLGTSGKDSQVIVALSHKNILKSMGKCSHRNISFGM